MKANTLKNLKKDLRETTTKYNKAKKDASIKMSNFYKGEMDILEVLIEGFEKDRK